MAGAHGGYRQPSTPAPVSGPGRLSRRTDGQVQADLPNAKYGEQADFQAIQSGAPMAAAPSPPGAGTGAPVGPSESAAPMAPPTPLTAPSARPWEPVTAGSPLGPGPGPIAGGYTAGTLGAQLAQISGPDTTGDVANLIEWIQARGL